MSNRQVVDNKPSLRTLAYVLRNREFWPEGFEWDYSFCGTCALGMAKLLWGIDPTADHLHEAFDLQYFDTETIFTNPALMRRRARGDDVTPEEIADLIDEHLAAAQ